jgi:2'-5' RNA ligase
MPDRTRTFIAVAVPDALGARLARLQAQLEAEVPEVRWVQTQPFHITLAFLGDVDVSDLAAVCRAAEDVAAAFPPLDLKLEGLGAFPSASKPRVVWAGVTGAGVEPLLALQEGLAQAAARLKYPTEARAFHPHVTLGRLRPGRGSGRDLTRPLNQFHTWRAGPFTVAEIVTFSSTTIDGRPAYTPLGHASLKGERACFAPGRVSITLVGGTGDQLGE